MNHLISLKPCIERLFRHCQDQSEDIRQFCIHQLSQLGVDCVQEAIGWEEFYRGVEGVVRGLRGEEEGEMGRWVTACMRKMIGYEMEKRGWNAFQVSREELHQLIADVVSMISRGNELDVWKRFLPRIYRLLQFTSTN